MKMNKLHRNVLIGIVILLVAVYIINPSLFAYGYPPEDTILEIEDDYMHYPEMKGAHATPWLTYSPESELWSQGSGPCNFAYSHTYVTEGGKSGTEPQTGGGFEQVILLDRIRNLGHLVDGEKIMFFYNWEADCGSGPYFLYVAWYAPNEEEPPEENCGTVPNPDACCVTNYELGGCGIDYPHSYWDEQTEACVCLVGECITDVDCRGEPVTCDDGSEWYAPNTCVEGTCYLVTTLPPESCIATDDCTTNADCDADQVCTDGECEELPPTGCGGAANPDACCANVLDCPNAYWDAPIECVCPDEDVGDGALPGGTVSIPTGGATPTEVPILLIAVLIIAAIGGYWYWTKKKKKKGKAYG